MAEQPPTRKQLPTNITLHRFAFLGHAKAFGAFRELLKAHEYAADAHCDSWDFAVEISALRQEGLTDTDLRWLISKNFVEHQLDVTALAEEGRRFKIGNRLNFQSDSCFVLTMAGVAFVNQLFETRKSTAVLPLVFQHTQGISPMPYWDEMRRQLRVAEFVVKQFRWPAPNQEIVLKTFQEEGWSKRIDDPLVPTLGLEPRQRLHDTVKCLNRRQNVRLIHFHGDGSGQGVTWQFTAEASGVLGIDLSEDVSTKKLG